MSSKFFNRIIENQSDYLAPWSDYDVANLPLTFTNFEYNKTGTDPVTMLKPQLQKLDGTGVFKDVVIGLPSARILFDFTPYDERERYKNTPGGVPEANCSRACLR